MERSKIKSIKQKAGVSAVIGVVLMIVITVVIAETVYVYVIVVVNEQNDSIVNNTFSVTGKLRSIVNTDCYRIVIGNKTIDKVYKITSDDYQFILTLVDKNVTFNFYVQHGTISGDAICYNGSILNN